MKEFTPPASSASLRRLSGTDILGIERELAKRIPIPATAYGATVRPSKNPIRGPHHAAPGIQLDRSPTKIFG
jgi:hypothetical protein